MESGAGDGNRTRVASLEDWNSTIELHPPKNPVTLGQTDRQRQVAARMGWGFGFIALGLVSAGNYRIRLMIRIRPRLAPPGGARVT